MEPQAVEEPIETGSDFGRGLCYCLGLFLEHSGRLNKQIADYESLRGVSPDLFSEESAVEIWFNGAADHFFELEVDHAPESLRERITTLRNKGLQWRLSINCKAATRKDADWAIQEAKDLLRLIDEAHSVPVCQGQYE